MKLEYVLDWEEYRDARMSRSWKRLSKLPSGSTLRVIQLCFRTVTVGCILMALSLLYLLIFSSLWWSLALAIPVYIFVLFRSYGLPRPASIKQIREEWDRASAAGGKMSFSASDQGIFFETALVWYCLPWNVPDVRENETMFVLGIESEGCYIPKRILTPDLNEQIRRWIAAA